MISEQAKQSCLILLKIWIGNFKVHFKKCSKKPFPYCCERNIIEVLGQSEVKLDLINFILSMIKSAHCVCSLFILFLQLDSICSEGNPGNIAMDELKSSEKPCLEEFLQLVGVHLQSKQQIHNKELFLAAHFLLSALAGTKE